MSSEPVLLPVWIMAYSFREKVYRFLVNGQTGQADGGRRRRWGRSWCGGNGMPRGGDPVRAGWGFGRPVNADRGGRVCPQTPARGRGTCRTVSRGIIEARRR